jgi:hypothetical protein
MTNLAHIDDMYEQVNQTKLEYIRRQHAWLTEPLYRASDAVKEMPFFEWLNQLETPLEFKSAAVQLFYHSATFPKVMGLMLGTTPLS